MRLTKIFYYLPLLAGLPFQLPALCKTFPYPNGELTIEGLWVQRKGVRNENLIIPPQCSNCPNTLTTSRVVHHMNWEPGVRGMLRYMPSHKRTVEFGVTWVHEFKSKVTRTSPTSSYSYPFSHSTYAMDYLNARRVKARYTSQYWDAEANYWANFTPRNVNYFSVSAMLGLRGVYLGEHFKLSYTKALHTSDYTARTLNRIVGPQAGGILQWNPNCHWTWEILLKTGVFADFAKQNLQLKDQNNSVTLKNFHSHKVFSTTFLEGSLSLFYRFRYNVSTHVGYRALGLWGLALAPMQLTGKDQPTSGDKVDHSGKIYLHFVSLGFDFDF